jgi:hypothetical protein
VWECSKLWLEGNDGVQSAILRGMGGAFFGVLWDNSDLLAAEKSLVALDSALFGADSGVLSFDSGMRSVNSGKLSVDSGMLSLNSRMLPLDSRVLSVDSGMLSVASWVFYKPHLDNVIQGASAPDWHPHGVYANERLRSSHFVFSSFG